MTNKITFSDGKIIENIKGETVLESLEKAGKQPRFACRQGHCGACARPLLSGQVDYHLSPLAFIPKGKFLPCCSTANGTIEIE